MDDMPLAEKEHESALVRCDAWKAAYPSSLSELGSVVLCRWI